MLSMTMQSMTVMADRICGHSICLNSFRIIFLLRPDIGFLNNSLSHFDKKAILFALYRSVSGMQIMENRLFALQNPCGEMMFYSDNARRSVL